MDEVTLNFTYVKEEIVPAQKLRFLHSNGFKFILALGAFSVILLTGGVVYFWYIKGVAPAPWFVPVIVAGIFIIVPLVLYFLAPGMDFDSNSGWRSSFALGLSDAGFSVSVNGRPEAFKTEWSQVWKVLETPQIYILYFGRGVQDFFMLPRRVLSSAGQEEAVCDILKRYNPQWKTLA